MKRTITLVLTSVFIMIGLPWLTVTFASHDAGMMLCFLLFFVIDPIYAVIAGIAAGRDWKRSWFQPFLTSLLFLAGAWLFFDEKETAFFGYAGAYTVLGLTAMAVTALLRRACKSK